MVYNCGMIVKLNAKQLRKLSRNSSVVIRKKRKTKNEIYIVLDNVLDTYNIGSIFRLADAVAAKKIYLCGGTETPPNHRIKKASINTMEVVEWEYCETALEAIAKVRQSTSKVKKMQLHLRGEKSEGGKLLQIVVIEQSNKSVPYDQFKYTMPICLVVGHESDGVSKEVLKMCDAVVELPMFGVNKSLNVMVSLGIVLYQVIESNMLKS